MNVEFFRVEPNHVQIASLGNTPKERLFRLAIDGGNLVSVFRQRGDYQIDKIWVDPNRRREGIAGLLLQASQEHAEEMGATVLTAAITSRPCLSAMAREFGKDNIKIVSEGEFPDASQEPTTFDTTRAYLVLDLDTSQNS